jgi:hypothetical protein
MKETPSEAVAAPRPPYARLVQYTPVRQFPAVADGKATALLAAFGLILSTLLFLSRPLGTMIKSSPPWEALLLTVALGTLLLLMLAGVVYALRTLTLSTSLGPETLVFFQQIAGREPETYRAEVQAVDHRQASRELLVYHHTMALLCAAKFSMVEKGVRCLRGTFYLWLLLMLRLILPL